MQHINPNELGKILTALRQMRPLIHCITNHVVTNFTANTLLAISAIPAMVVAPQEVKQFTPICDALSVNVGTLDAPQAEAISVAVKAAEESNKPWVLDPVGVSPVLKFRSEFVQNLLKQHKPTIIRGNAAEIVALNNQLHQKQEGRTSPIADFSASRGPDSKLKSTEHVQAAESLSRLLTGSIIVMTGETDFIAHHKYPTVGFSNGSELMTKVTGIGCSLSAICAAFVAAVRPTGDEKSVWNATIAAVATVSIAGELAATNSHHPGSFAVEFIDRLASFSEKDFNILRGNIVTDLN